MKRFDIPGHYRSSVISRLKEWRRVNDPRKKDFSPAVLDFDLVQIVIPRHMGFCYGVENAIEISHRALQENPDKRIFLLSQMIHNPAVNSDLESRGIRFIMDTEGKQFIPWESITPDDVVITPAFGTTVEIETILQEKGVQLATYNTTCPFVEKVWKRSAEIGNQGFTVIIHGKHLHEETRATFSHSYQNAPSLVIRDMNEAKVLAAVIRGERSTKDFNDVFSDRFSRNFDPDRDLRKVGVVNQTTMLASETLEIADFIRSVIVEKYGPSSYADTRDTLCYATNDNQDATFAARDADADFALVVGGYNSSNTAQLVQILGKSMPVYFISGEADLLSSEVIRHYDYPAKAVRESAGWVPSERPFRMVLTSGASCPDAEVEAVMSRLLLLIGSVKPIEEVLDALIGRV
jgi:4-hydroxy-3-methylbut-2-en-1-yl diphosphate reductase